MEQPNIFDEAAITVTGSRSITDKDFVFKCLDDFLKTYNLTPSQVILNSGHAVGVDRLAEEWGTFRNIRGVMKYIPDWNVGRAAGMIRNKAMVSHCEYVCGIWDGVSRGTKGCLDYAEEKGKIVKVYLYEKTN